MTGAWHEKVYIRAPYRPTDRQSCAGGVETITWRGEGSYGKLIKTGFVVCGLRRPSAPDLQDNAGGPRDRRAWNGPLIVRGGCAFELSCAQVLKVQPATAAVAEQSTSSCNSK